MLDRRLYAPMLVSKRATLPFADPNWLFELKFDGWRSVVTISGGKVAIVSRHSNDITAKFRHLSAIAEAVVGDDIVLDGEICALDEQGRPDFFGVARRDPPATFIAFDVLHANGVELIGKPLEERQAVLAQVVPIDTAVLMRSRPLGSDALALWPEIEARYLEGLVGKRKGSKYRPGTRTHDWVRIKTGVARTLERARFR